ncbi:MAG: nitroreductase family protein [Acholeplasmatales bacterium]|jgi:nitroreductase|nr:nitroreductase family protein [Acholeplasmatales bacterium]
MDFKELVNSRYSVRKYEPRKVEQAKIDYLVECATTYPSGRNGQDAELLVISDDKLVSELKDNLRHHFDASLFFIVSYDIESAPRFGRTDASIMLTYLMLGATSLGLGSCWTASYDENLVKLLLHYPPNKRIEGILVVGYKDSSASPSEFHENRDKTKANIKYNEF